MKQNRLIIWIHTHLKTLTILFFILGISLLTLSFIRTGFDYWWHIKAGEYMTLNKTILTKDIFSWFATKHQLSWFAHEWLSEIFLYIVKVLTGQYHIIVYCGILLLILYLILFLGNKKNYSKNIPFTLFWVTLGIIFLGSTLMPRPQLFSYIFTALTVYFLFDLARDEFSKKIYFLPLITVLWANFHGGSSNLSYILCFTFWFIGHFSFSLGKVEAKSFTKIQLKKYLLVMFLCIAVIPLNPQGLDLLWYPYQNMQDSFMLKTISEWQPSNPNKLSDIAIFCFFGYWILLLLISDRKIKLLDLLLLAMFAFLALKSIRFWPFTYIVSSFIIFDYIKQRDMQDQLNYVFLIFSIVICLIVFPKKDISTRVNAPVIDEVFIETLKELKPDRLYNYYSYGGYLIYRDIPVFIDGRADLYSKYNYRDYYHLSLLETDFVSLLDHYQFDMLLLDKGLPLSYYLKNHADYEIVIEKDNTVLYRFKQEKSISS